MIRLERSDILIAQSTHAGETGKNNEDRAVTGAFRDSAGSGDIVTLAMVADGIGGHAAGEIASDLAVRSVYDHLERGDSRSPLGTLEAALLAANQAIYERSHSEPQLAGMGSTAVVALLVGRKLYVAHVGDSRLYLIRGDTIRQMTVDHTWVQEAMSAGLLTKEEARKHPNRHVIRRYLGHNLDTNPVDLTLKLAPGDSPEQMERNQGTLLAGGDKLLLCSDGLTDLVEDDEIRAAVTQNEPQAACEQLVLLARQRGGYDNITVVLAHVPAEPLAPAAPTRLVTPARRLRRRNRALVFGLIGLGGFLLVAALAGGAALLYLNRGSLGIGPTVPLPTAAPTLQVVAPTAGAALPPGDDTTPTATPEASETPTATALPSETATATATPQPMATIAGDTAVHVEPDPESQELGNLLAGSSVVVRGRDPEGLWWYIEYPTGTSSRGWVFQAVTIWSFDVNIVPVVDAFGTPIFTPTQTQATQSANNAGPPPGESATPQG